MHFLVTGHTGFKGSWLTMLLRSRGHDVSGLALPPPRAACSNAPTCSAEAGPRPAVRHPGRRSRRGGLPTGAAGRGRPSRRAAARSESLLDPATTYETNVMGTFNVLEGACAPHLPCRRIVVVTTDKVYRNVGQSWGYREHDPLGGDDPYSASKAMAELLTQSWIHSTERVRPPPPEPATSSAVVTSPRTGCCPT